MRFCLGVINTQNSIGRSPWQAIYVFVGWFWRENYFEILQEWNKYTLDNDINLQIGVQRLLNYATYQQTLKISRPYNADLGCVTKMRDKRIKKRRPQ